MSTLTGKDLNLVKPALTDDYKVTIGTDLPANFQKIDDEFTAHLAEDVADGVHGMGRIASQDYAEGIFTPSLHSGASYLSDGQIGRYTKVGKLVTISILLTLTAKPPEQSSTPVIIFGLPFVAVGQSEGVYGITLAQYTRINTGGKSVFGRITPASASIELYKHNDTLGTLDSVKYEDLSDNTYIFLSATYKTN